MSREDREDAEEMAQLREVAKTMATPGWPILLMLLGDERERQIKDLKKAKTESKFEFLRGQLAGFDATVFVFDRVKRKIEDEDAKASDPKEGAGYD